MFISGQFLSIFRKQVQCKGYKSHLFKRYILYVVIVVILASTRIALEKGMSPT